MTEYAAQARPDLDELERVYRESGLAERRPMDRLAEAQAGANLWVTAREQGRLVGVARSVTDFAWTTYLADLAVVRERQRTGVGRELVRLTAAAAPQAKLILLAAPAAADYYPRLGMERHPAAFTLTPKLQG